MENVNMMDGNFFPVFISEKKVTLCSLGCLFEGDEDGIWMYPIMLRDTALC